MRRVTDSRADEVALNRALWAVVNERFTDAAADELWARPDAVWGLFAVPSASSACSATWPGSTCSSWPAAPPTSRRGSPARAPAPWRSTSPGSSWPPPAGCSAGSARCSRWCSATASGCRWPTAASTSW